MPEFFYRFIVLSALFLVYSFIGWIIEVIYTLFMEKKINK